MFSFLFKRKPILFEIVIQLSRRSNVTLVKKGNDVKDKDYILLGLLIYARLLRLFRLKSNDPKIAPYTFFTEALKTQANFKSDAEFLKKLSDTIEVMKNNYEKETSLRVVCRGDSKSDKVIYTGVPLKELECYVYTVYSFVSDNISDQNKFVLFKLFAALSTLKLTKEITANDAINFPNMAVTEVAIT